MTESFDIRFLILSGIIIILTLVIVFDIDVTNLDFLINNAMDYITDNQRQALLVTMTIFVIILLIIIMVLNIRNSNKKTELEKRLEHAKHETSRMITPVWKDEVNCTNCDSRNYYVTFDNGYFYLHCTFCKTKKEFMDFMTDFKKQDFQISQNRLNSTLI